MNNPFHDPILYPREWARAAKFLIKWILTPPEKGDLTGIACASLLAFLAAFIIAMALSPFCW